MPSPSPNRHRAALGVAFFCCAMVALSACEKRQASPSPSPAPTAWADGLPPADQTYTVRARIVALPGQSPGQFLQVHHEAIPEFIGKNGEKVGMKEMTMDFPALAGPSLLDGLAVGASVEMTFEVRWKSGPRSLVTRLVPLD